MSTRQEHIEFCKKRAKAYLDQGDVTNGITSMLSDLNKHEETRFDGSTLSSLGMMYVMNNDLAGARRFVEGFN